MKWWNHINVNCDGSSGDAFSRMECQEAKPGTTLNTCRSRGNLVDKRAIRGHSVIPWGTPILSSRKTLRLKSDPSTNPTDFDFFDSFAATVSHTRPHPFPARVEKTL
ncbi:hypothetical protein V1477_012245 [Vespula maculifrons]|uniref:Uncharacterized protein n=1 Tax=Vespula maculifrons TaxID=7453 RepID=A0ABD2BWX9_VESMC